MKINFLDKLTQLADKTVKKVEEVSSATAELYKNEGVEGFFNKADQGINKVEKAANNAAGKTADYFKDVGKRNKEVVKKVSKDNLEGKLNAGLAATVNTVNILTGDIVKKARNVINDLTDKEQVPVSVQLPVMTEPTLDPRYKKLDATALSDVMKFIGAKLHEDQYRDKVGNIFAISGDRWYNFANESGGKGAVSLFAYHLSSFKSVDYVKEKKSLMNESLNILEQLSLSHETKVSNDEPKVIAKKSVKTVAVKMPAKKVAIKKTAVKKVPVKEVKEKILPVVAKKVIKKKKM